MSENVLSILIIEDQKFCADLFRAAFQRYEITAAHNGAEGVAAYKVKRPDMVFLDIGLPDMSGFDVLQQLRALDGTAHVVMLTGMNNDAYAERCRELGAQGLLGKPYRKESIEHYIARCKDLRA